MTATTAETSERRSEVLHAAAEQFSKRGYQGTSMDDIARAVGLNKGTLYHYVSSKADLLYEVYRTSQRNALDTIESLPDAMHADDAIAVLIERHLTANLARHAEVSVYFQEMHWVHEWLSTEQVAEIRESERRYLERLTKIVARGAESGRFAVTDAPATAAMIIGVIAWTHRWLHESHGASVDDVARTFADLVLNGLTAGGGSATGHVIVLP